MEKALLDEAAERRYQKALALQRQEELAQEARRAAEESALAAAAAAAHADGDSNGGAVMMDAEPGHGNGNGSPEVKMEGGNGHASLDDEQAGRKRRRASGNVDYKALDEKLKKEAQSPPAGNGAAAE